MAKTGADLSSMTSQISSAWDRMVEPLSDLMRREAGDVRARLTYRLNILWISFHFLSSRGVLELLYAPTSVFGSSAA